MTAFRGMNLLRRWNRYLGEIGFSALGSGGLLISDEEPRLALACVRTYLAATAIFPTMLSPASAAAALSGELVI